jgi:hypothetical protein
MFAIALIVMVSGITLSAILGAFFKYRERRLELQAGAAAEKAAMYAVQTERLEQRMRVLERIVTDKGIVVADEIERLRHEPLN